jgi:putative zinc finger protein
MKCQDVRRAFPLLIAGEIPLTEWALIETHLVGCAECRKELDRQRAQVVERARVRRRNATTAALVATAVLLVVAGAGFYVYQGSLPDPYRPGPVRVPPRSPSAPITVTPVAPPPAARPVPPSVPVPAPAAPKSQAVVETAAPSVPVRPPAATLSEGVPRPVRSPASAVRPPDPPAAERMPTQARPPAAVTAAPGAEAMPTQGAARPAPHPRE